MEHLGNDAEEEKKPEVNDNKITIDFNQKEQIEQSESQTYSGLVETTDALKSSGFHHSNKTTPGQIVIDDGKKAAKRRGRPRKNKVVEDHS